VCWLLSRALVSGSLSEQIVRRFKTMEGSPSLAETMVDDREILINQQRNEIAALRAQLAEAGLQPENSARPPRPSPVSRRPKQKLGPTDGEDTHAFYDLDTNRLVRPSELLIGDKVGHNFKHIMSDFSELQRRVLRRVLAAGEKKERVEKYLSKLQGMQQSVDDETEEAEKAARNTMSVLRAELNQVEEALFGYIGRVHQNNTTAIQDQVNFCKNLVADIEEGLGLAQDFLLEAKEDSELKPITVIQSIEVGLDELQEATVKRRPELTPLGVLNVEPVLNSFHALSFQPGVEPASTSDKVGISPAKGSPPAYERLHRIAVRKAIEKARSPQRLEPFSSFPASPPHSTGLGLSTK